MATPTVVEIPLDAIRPGPNDRVKFDEKSLRELADSIGEHGLAQPITVRRKSGRDGQGFEIVAGERRWRACKLAGMKTIPAFVRRLNDEQAAAIMLLENVSRKDLDPIEEALAYKKRMDQFGWTAEECAKNAGVSSIMVQFRLKLLGLTPNLQAAVAGGQLPIGYAQCLADRNLDNEMQWLAFRRLRDNPNPTPTWFRKEVSQLEEQASQTSMFDDEDDDQPEPVQRPLCDISNVISPELPTWKTAPVQGDTMEEVIANQAAFWTRHADRWAAGGHNFKRDQCLAAAAALLGLLGAMESKGA